MLSRTSTRPAKPQSNWRLRSAKIVRASTIQSKEKGLYFRQRWKWRAQGARAGMNSSTNPCPCKRGSKAELRRSEILALGKALRRLLRKGTSMARSPKFQNSTTRMRAGDSAEFVRGGRGGISGFTSLAMASNMRTRCHLVAVIRKEFARAAASKVLVVSWRCGCITAPPRGLPE